MTWFNGGKYFKLQKSLKCQLAYNNVNNQIIIIIPKREPFNVKNNLHIPHGSELRAFTDTRTTHQLLTIQKLPRQAIKLGQNNTSLQNVNAFTDMFFSIRQPNPAACVRRNVAARAEAPFSQVNWRRIVSRLKVAFGTT